MIIIIHSEVLTIPPPLSLRFDLISAFYPFSFVVSFQFTPLELIYSQWPRLCQPVYLPLSPYWLIYSAFYCGDLQLDLVSFCWR